jgi:hypothetical protein
LAAQAFDLLSRISTCGAELSTECLREKGSTLTHWRFSAVDGEAQIVPRVGRMDIQKDSVPHTLKEP